MHKQLLSINRRKVMLSAVAGVSGLALGRAFDAPVQAQSAAMSVSNAGNYHFRVGDIKATVVSDGTIGGPPRIYASDAPELELSEALRQAFLPSDYLTLNLNTLLIETGGRRILLEAGAGQTMGLHGGKIFANLTALGLRPDDIDVIVVSHTHPDHVGNLRAADGSKAFPRATVFAPRADWDFFVRGEPDLSYMPVPEDFRRRFGAAIKRSVEPIAKDVELYEAGTEIVPGLTTLVAGGHTPGMATFLVHSGDAQLLLTADLAYHPVVNIDNAWLPGPDRDKETAQAARQRIFDRAASERMLVLGFHYPFPGLGRMLKLYHAYAWVPAQWQV
ncbi:MBL fold metallo-hydrolase [Alcaligenaceae bacterium A4P071]|nr:MBL fold metallo-hydrolase [Alcaligenaceae bacterium A4P071]